MSEYDITSILSSIWPEWSITGLLGIGTYGNVYKITRNNDMLNSDTAVISESAVKIISIPRDHAEIDTLGSNTNFVEQVCREYESIVQSLSREIKLLESLKGAPNVVHIEDYKILKNQDGISWTIVIRMELLKPIKELYPFSEVNAIRLGIDICSALAICAQKNIIHRDIKPSNILCTEFGTYKLGDFGISRMFQQTNDSMTNGVGTPNFVAPEVISGQTYDYRADIYSLGMVLYHLLNNQIPPFCPLDKQILSYQDRMDAYLRRMHGEVFPKPANASEGMSEIIRKACAFRPEERYADALEMKKALTELLEPQTSLASQNSTDVPNVIKKTHILPIMFLIVLLTAGTAGYLGYNYQQNSVSAAEINESATQKEVLPAVFRLEIEEYPARTLFSVGETPDLTGLVLLAEYEDGTAESIRTGYEYSRQILEKTGAQKISVSYGGCSVDVTVAVKELFRFELNEDGESYTLTELLDKEAAHVALPEFYYEKPVTTIGERSFEKCRITEIIVPEGYMTLEGHAFFSCSELKRVVLPQTLIYFPNKFDSHAAGTPFANCDSLVSLEITPGNPLYHSEGNCIIETASKILLYGCSGSIIPEDGSVEIIGEAACAGRKMDVLQIPEGIVCIEEDAFIGSSIREMYIPSTVTYIHSTAFIECGKLEKITISPENKTYHSDGNCAIETAARKLVLACPSSVIPKDGSVTKIGEYAYYLSNLMAIELPETITGISSAVFSYSDLRSIRIPSKVKELCEHVFLHCSNLETVHLPAGLSLIQASAFAECNALKTIYYAGSKADWERITIEDDNNELLNAEIIFDYTD